MIAVPGGEVPVEALRIGDKVRTADGRAVPVLWVGRQRLRNGRAAAHAQPVRISAGAFAPGVPRRDLIVTGDHGMVLYPSSGEAVGGQSDGYVINASALVNGHNVCWVSMADLPEQVVYYHVETSAHDVILANGAAAESFIDAAGRAAFDNHQEYLDLYGTERIIPEMRMPRISSARLVPPRLRASLLLRAQPAA